MRATTTRRSSAYEKRNFTLRTDTSRLLDRLPRDVNRSRLVDEAIRERLAGLTRAKLRKQLEEGYTARAADNLRMVEEWFGLEEEAWEIASRASRK